MDNSEKEILENLQKIYSRKKHLQKYFTKVVIIKFIL